MIKKTNKGNGGAVISELKAREYKRFEDIKHVRADGSEYWLARELSIELDYAQWRNFTKVLDKAKLACMNSGLDIDDHFAEVSKTIQMPKSATKNVPGRTHVCEYTGL